LGFKTLDDVEVAGRTVILRVDINSPIDPQTNEILDDTRIRVHAETVNELLGKGAKLVILAHQGRKGDPDYTTLQKHSEVMRKYVSNLKYVPDVVGDEARSAIRSLRPGEALLLENVRSLDEETKDKPAVEHSKGALVSSLAPLADLFVNDAFAAAHRSHASVVGFTAVLPSAAGRVMERELKALERVADSPEKPCLYILGGAKPKETFAVIDHVLGRGISDDVLLGGLIAQVFMLAKGVELGMANRALIEEKGFAPTVERARRSLEAFGDSIVLPFDFGVDDGKRSEVTVKELPVEKHLSDIGELTIAFYSKLIKYAKTVVMNGPMGVFEDERFAKGTVEVVRAIGKSKAYSLLGGGHSIAALEKYGLTKSISYVSTAGGAMISYLSGEKLPGVEALRSSK
jgi:phosphoglycerate kinase